MLVHLNICRFVEKSRKTGRFGEKTVNITLLIKWVSRSYRPNKPAWALWFEHSLHFPPKSTGGGSSNLMMNITSGKLENWYNYEFCRLHILTTVDHLKRNPYMTAGLKPSKTFDQEKRLKSAQRRAGQSFVQQAV